MQLPTSVLPPALLELTFIHAFSPPKCLISGCSSGGIPYLRRVAGARYVHQAALATSPPPPVYEYPYSPSSRAFQARGSERQVRKMERNLAARSGDAVSNTPSELHRRVQALEEAAAAEKSVLDTPALSENELLSLYEDLLAVPSVEKSIYVDPELEKQTQAENDTYIINGVDQRLRNSAVIEDRDSPLSNAPQVHILRGSSDTAHKSGSLNLESSAQPYRRVLSCAHDIVSRLEAVQLSLSPSPDSKTSVSRHEFLPVSILSIKEYESLIRVCINAQDSEAAELALDLMKRSGVTLSNSAVTTLLEFYAQDGNVNRVEHVLATYLTAFPTERQRHLHVKSHLKATPSEIIPTSALAVLHSYETQTPPAPMQTYTSLITALFSTSSSIGRAQAWDLFSHMRYVAHPEPDVHLYTLMIRACASPISSSRSSEPEKALDLWTEMTIDHRLPPTTGAYNAAILACSRSGSKMYVNEAFRLAREMLDSHRDARGHSAFRPDRRTCCALLEGAKRLGDLAKARWILAEMVNERRNEREDVEAEGVNEEVMMHVFHTYAAYQTPFTRATALLVHDQSAQTGSQQRRVMLDVPESSIPIRQELEETEKTLALVDARSSFTHIPPQSRSEVIGEVKYLFEHILRDTGTYSDSNGAASGDNLAFSGVLLTSRLVNSYLSVYYKHSSLEKSRDLFWKLFEECGVTRTPRTYVEALERCSIARRGRERTLALEFADELWAKWLKLEESGKEDGRALSGRLVERAHIAFIRVLTLAGNTERAMQQVRSFANQYPPSKIRRPTAKLALRSTRTVLVGQRPLVRMTSTSEVPDDNVPPLLTFNDLEMLHHRLVALDAAQEIGYLKYVCKAYEWALRARRDETMRAEPSRSDASPTA